MTHSELVQAATNLIAEVSQADLWLERYDAALASATDRELTDLVGRFRATLHVGFPLAA